MAILLMFLALYIFKGVSWMAGQVLSFTCFAPFEFLINWMVMELKHREKEVQL